MAELSTFAVTKNTLGESPFWHEGRKSVFWVDIEKGLLLEQGLLSENIASWEVGDKLLLGSQDGIGTFDLITAQWKLKVPIEIDNISQRSNDGTFDINGNIWIGNMHLEAKEDLGILYRIEEDMRVLKVKGNLTIPNGLVFSSDNQQMYFIDTPTRTVKAFSMDQFGELLSEKAAIVIPENMGMPDGMTIDNKGMLWVALYGGAAVSRWNPENGALLETIAIPALHVTNCCFVGEELNELIVTSAKENLTDTQLAMYPQSGNVFSIKNLGVCGVKMLSHKPSTTFFQ
jgi:sugar lactone lactonase YvrE